MNNNKKKMIPLYYIFYITNDLSDNWTWIINFISCIIPKII